MHTALCTSVAFASALLGFIIGLLYQKHTYELDQALFNRAVGKFSVVLLIEKENGTRAVDYIQKFGEILATAPPSDRASQINQLSSIISPDSEP